MIQPTLSSIFHVFSKTRRQTEFKGVCSVDAFRALLSRERDRVDRSGGMFSLMSFKSLSPGSEPTHLRTLIEAVNQRKRSIDEMGWLKNRCLGVFLPNTPLNGATKLAAELIEKTNLQDSLIDLQICAYPDGSVAGKGSVEGSTPFSETPEGFSSENQNCTDHQFLLNYLVRLPLWKRCIDILASAIGLLMLFPVFMLIAAGIKIFSPGPALFTQERVGLLSRTFTLWKFRTMDVNADQSIHKKHLHYLIRSESPLKKLDEESDPRIFPFGNLLRQFGLDELPQLINVLRGEMSLIGPRPCIPYEAEELFLWHRRRFDCLPGLTGLWQVSGKNRTTYSSMMRLDIRYASNVSLRRDVKILLKTIPSVIAQAYEQPIEEGGKEYAGTN